MVRDVVYRSPTLKAIYAPNLRSWARIARNKTLRASCIAFAEAKARPYAERISPVGQTGVYKKSWKVEPGHTVINGLRRVCARLINTADHSAAVEFGNRTTEPQRILGQTRAYLNATGIR